MLKNFLTISLRNMRRHPGYSVLNILGLTLGILATLFILLFITKESSFDTYHEKADRIYRISSAIQEPDDAFRWSVTQAPLAPQLKEDYPEVEQYVRFVPNGRTRLELKEKFYFVEKVFVVDSTVNDVFTFDFVRGDANTALREPNSIVLDETTAARIFGTEDPMGKVFKTPSDRDYKVTGVYKDMPGNSHLIAEAMISSNSIPGLMTITPQQWGSFGMYSYVLLKEGTDPDAFAAKLPEVITKYVATIFDQFEIKVQYELLPLKTIHLNSTFQGEPEPSGEKSFLYIFGAVALFILMIACINYMNLSTARATMRSMEVGVKKVLGSGRKELIWQFLSESLVFTLISLILSFGLAHLLLNSFNSTFNVSLDRNLLWSPQIQIGAIAIVLISGILGGSYPAFYLSAFNPIHVLKGTLAKGSGNPLLRKSLVVVQFIITIFTIVSMGVIYNQMHYLRNKNIGFDKDHIMTFSIQGPDAGSKILILRDKLLQNPKITLVGTATTSPGNGFGKQVMNVENETGVMEQYGVDNYGVDYDFFPTLGVEIVAGRNFSRDFGTDTSSAVMVNASMVKRFGWTDPIGKKFQFGPVDTLPFVQVVGVVKDFHQQSLYEPIAPLLFYLSSNNSEVHARINPSDAGDVSHIITYAEKQWNESFPNTPFEYQFVDEAFYKLYAADQIRARIFALFSILMLLIACLGLLGLASFTAEQRGKEISVRRILGAKTSDIVVLLTSNYALLISIATIPAFIAAWIFMHRWLGTFAYHSEMNYWLYALAFVIVLLIALATTGYHALKAVSADPVERLRNE